MSIADPSSASSASSPDVSPICSGCHAVAALDREVEARVAQRLETDAWRWRFRLLTIETVMMAGLVLIAGLMLHQPAELVLRATLLVGASCFASGMLILGLSTGTGKLLSRFRRRRAS